MPSALNNWLVLLGWGLPPWATKGSELFPEMKDLINQVITLSPFSHHVFFLLMRRLCISASPAFGRNMYNSVRASDG